MFGHKDRLLSVGMPSQRLLDVQPGAIEANRPDELFVMFFRNAAKTLRGLHFRLPEARRLSTEDAAQ